MLLGYIAYLTRLTKGPYSLLWVVLSLGFLYLSIDETAYIHENFSTDVAGWTVVVAPFVILFLIGYIRFFLHLPRSTKLYFLLAGFLFIGGAFFLEFIGSWRTSIADENNVAQTYLVFTTVEESFEMFGINLFIYSLLLYLRDNFPDYHLSFQNPNQ
jgi:drug/metabolite transporter (DMT)-like permease